MSKEEEEEINSGTYSFYEDLTHIHVQLVSDKKRHHYGHMCKWNHLNWTKLSNKFAATERSIMDWIDIPRIDGKQRTWNHKRFFRLDQTDRSPAKLEQLISELLIWNLANEGGWKVKVDIITDISNQCEWQNFKVMRMPDPAMKMGKLNAMEIGKILWCHDQVDHYNIPWNDCDLMDCLKLDYSKIFYLPGMTRAVHLWESIS